MSGEAAGLYKVMIGVYGSCDKKKVNVYHRLEGHTK
jgi:hypothetical protein